MYFMHDVDTDLDDQNFYNNHDTRTSHQEHLTRYAQKTRTPIDAA